MKIIDLLNKIANGEEVPKKIKYNNIIFTIREEKDDYVSENSWFTDCYCFLDLNEEVEILDEPKENFTGWKMYQDGKVVCSIEGLKKENKIEYLEKVEDFKFVRLIDKINELIDEVNKLKEK